MSADTTAGAAPETARVRNLRISFGGVPAVDGVSFELGRGECVAVVGASGAGKSVTARALLGLAGDHASVTADRMEVGGADVRGLSARGWRALRGRRVGLVLQDALVALDPLRPVGREIGESLRVRERRGTRARHRERVHALLSDAGVPDPAERARRYPHELSGGQRQRALIASALAQGPDLLVADEPTTALDRTVAAKVLRLLAGQAQKGRSVLLVSHDLSAVALVADRVLVMDRGRLVESGPTSQVLAAPEHPATRGLVEASRALRPPARSRDPEGAGPEVLRLERVTKTYPSARGRASLAGVSLSLRRGEALGIVGGSGSGKTSLARVALALTRPDRGAVFFDGAPWSGTTERRRRPSRPRLQFIQQDPLSAFDPLWTVERVVSEALVGVRGGGTERRERVVRALGDVGLSEDVLGRRPALLSGGQRQRVAIARALVGGPDVLVCDEPVSALDARAQSSVLELLSRLRRERGLAMLFISHDLGAVAQVCDRVAVLHEGEVIEQGPVSTVLVEPEHPRTHELLAAVPALSAPGVAPGKEAAR